MLKAAFATFALALVTTAAHADDSSFPKIEVKKIDAGTITPGQKLSFSGKNADQFFKMLPATVSVSPTEDKKNQKKWRNLTVMNNEMAIEISCKKVIVDPNNPDKEIKNPEGTTCEITLTKSADIEGDSWDFKPMDAVAKSCKK